MQIKPIPIALGAVAIASLVAAAYVDKSDPNRLLTAQLDSMLYHGGTTNPSPSPAFNDGASITPAPTDASLGLTITPAPTP